MCFSAEADLVAGVVIGSIGLDALRHVRRPSEWPLAVVPVVLGAHQLIEAAVWSELARPQGDATWRPAATLYLLIAFVLLPVLVPVAVGALEPDGWSARARSFTVLGACVAAYLGYAVVRGPIVATIQGHHIDYQVNLWHGGLIVAFYLVATCGSVLLSHHRHVRWFGLVNLSVALLLVWLDRRAFISLWCAWAAVTSVAIAAHLRYRDHVARAERALAAP